MKIPKSLAAAADLYYRLRKQRLEEQKGLKALQENESMVKEHLIENLSSDTTGISGKEATVRVEKKDVYSVADWNKFNKWILENEALYFLSRSISQEAVEEYVEQTKTKRSPRGKLPPGVQRIQVKKLYVSQR